MQRRPHNMTMMMVVRMNRLVTVLTIIWCNQFCRAFQSPFTGCSFDSKRQWQYNKKVDRTRTTLFIGPQQLGKFEVLGIDESATSRRVPLIDLSNSPSPVSFTTAWDWQKDLLASHVERIADTDSTQTQFQSDDKGDGYGIDTVIMLQHEPVYTLGTGSDEKFVLSSEESKVPVVRMDR